MAKKKEMNRTSGTAKRKVDTAGKLLTSKEVGTAVKKGAPLTGSASGVKSISLKQAGEVLTQGIVTLGKKGLKFSPEGLAMALPLGKVAKAAKALRGTNMFTAFELEARLGAKAAGSGVAKEIARNAKIPKMGQQAAQDSYERVSELTRLGKSARGKSESVFPRGTDLAKRALKAKSETRAASRALGNQQFGFDRFVREADRIENKYGLNMRTAEEGLRQAKKRKGK